MSVLEKMNGTYSLVSRIFSGADFMQSNERKIFSDSVNTINAAIQ